MLAAGTKLEIASTRVSYRKPAIMPSSRSYQENKRNYPKESKSQFPNAQAVASVGQPEKKTGMLNIIKWNPVETEEDTYAAAAALVLEEEKSAEIGLQSFEQRVVV